MSEAIPPPVAATRPSSVSNTPHNIPVGLNGRPASQELFTYNLELALLSVLQRADEYGQDSVFRWRSEDQIYQNAWSTPSHWDWSSSDSYVSECSTPGASTPDIPQLDEDVSFEPPRAWSLIRSQIQSKPFSTTIEPKLSYGDTPLKRKFDDSDDEEWLHPQKKKMRWDADPSICIDELTPPTTPLSHARDSLKSFASSPNDPNFSSSSRITLGEITPPNYNEPKNFKRHLIPPLGIV